MQDVPSCQRGTSAQFCNRNGLWQPLAFALELDSELHPPKKRRTLAYKCAQRYQLYTQPQPTETLPAWRPGLLLVSCTACDAKHFQAEDPSWSLNEAGRLNCVAMPRVGAQPIHLLQFGPWCRWWLRRWRLWWRLRRRHRGRQETPLGV